MIIGKKIIGGFGFLLVLLLIAVTAGYYAINIVQTTYGGFIDVDERRIDDVNSLETIVQSESSDFRGYLLYDQTEYLNDLLLHYSQFDQTAERLRTFLLLKGEGDAIRLLEDIISLHDKYKQMQQDLIAGLPQMNRTDGVALSKENLPLRNELTDKIRDFGVIQIKLEAEERAKVTNTANNLSRAMIAVSVIAIISGLAIGIFITRSITRQLRDTISQITSSSSEILATTIQLASSSSETATSVNETSTTTEEVKHTSLLSNEKAKNLSDGAHKAASIAQEGKTALAQNMEAIDRIKNQTEMVAETIVKLNELTQTIGEITSTVNDLAEQSNLLAVNAAIEAAKAGEQGKGFAVVAGEIKNLAEQSKEGTVQVRTILNDIQKATSASVMATDQVNKAVEAGVKQASVAGDSINRLADTITEAAQAAIQVSASSQQQLTGIDQIVLAMENIKQATQQNMAGIKQVEKAVQNLNDLGQNLKSMVNEGKM